MRVKFETIFKVRKSEDIKYLKILCPINISGLSIERMEIGGTTIGGVDWSLFNGNDLEIIIRGKFAVIKGIYK